MFSDAVTLNLKNLPSGLCGFCARKRGSPPPSPVPVTNIPVESKAKYPPLLFGKGCLQEAINTSDSGSAALELMAVKREITISGLV